MNTSSCCNISHSNGSIKLTNNSSMQDAISVFNCVKAELAEQIQALNELKKRLGASDQVDANAKSHLSIAIESMLIELNEEVYALSEELALGYSLGQAASMVSKAREFDHRKKQLVKRVTKLLEED